jgi:hypothetical protein
MDFKLLKVDEQIYEVTIRGNLEEVTKLLNKEHVASKAGPKEYYCVECSFSPPVTIYSDEEYLGLNASGACQGASGGFYKNIKKGKCPS